MTSQWQRPHTSRFLTKTFRSESISPTAILSATARSRHVHLRRALHVACALGHTARLVQTSPKLAVLGTIWAQSGHNLRVSALTRSSRAHECSSKAAEEGDAVMRLRRESL
jgi:predicted transcriptional regulator